MSTACFIIPPILTERVQQHGRRVQSEGRPVSDGYDTGQGVWFNNKKRPGHLFDPEVRLYDASESKQGNRITSVGPYAGLIDRIKITDRFFQKTVQDTIASGKKIFVNVKDFRYYNNAFWVPQERRICFGEVDREFFSPMDESLDIMAHEMGHGITGQRNSIGQDANALLPHGEEGALNESMSDIFAVMLKHRRNGWKAGDADADWAFANDLIRFPDQSTRPLRSLASPGSAFCNHPVLGSDFQVSHYSNFKQSNEVPSIKNDWNGIHTYSGIPNHAFFLAAKDLQGSIDDTIGKIWINAYLAYKDTPTPFQTFAEQTIRESLPDKGHNHNVQDVVMNAWTKVGIDLRRSLSFKDPPKTSAAAIVVGVLGGVSVLCTAAGLVFAYRESLFGNTPNQILGV